MLINRIAIGVILKSCRPTEEEEYQEEDVDEVG